MLTYQTAHFEVQEISVLNSHSTNKHELEHLFESQLIDFLRS